MTEPENGQKRTHKKASTRLRKTLVLEVLRSTLGIVTTACERAGISRSQFYKWIETDEKFAADVNDIGSIALDFAESCLFKLMREGNPAATIFFLKTRGKSRGYVERQEITAEDGRPLGPLIIEYVNDWRGHNAGWEQ